MAYLIGNISDGVGAVDFLIDGGGSAITTGIKGGLRIPFACTINDVELTSIDGTTGSIVVDIWKDTYTNFPPIISDSICASNKPTISSGTKSQNATLSGWTTTINAGDYLLFNVDSATSVKMVLISFKITKR
jgi:hypothetical protein